MCKASPCTTSLCLHGEIESLGGVSFFIAICYHDNMKMFIILLVFVFALFFLGGSLLFDSGIADSKGIARIPVAVRVEKTYFEVRKQLVVVSPIISEVQKFFSGR